MVRSILHQLTQDQLHSIAYTQLMTINWHPVQCGVRLAKASVSIVTLNRKRGKENGWVDRFRKTHYPPIPQKRKNWQTPYVDYNYDNSKTMVWFGLVLRGSSDTVYIFFFSSEQLNSKTENRSPKGNRSESGQFLIRIEICSESHFCLNGRTLL